MRVSLILTVLNEAAHIPRLFDSIIAQQRQPDEVVVCDGGSTDDTVAIVNTYAGRLPIRVVAAPGANISTGRNTAIRAATGGLIVVTDAGVWLEPDWLAQLVAALESAPDGRPALAAGFYHADTETPFEVALGATVLPEWRDIDPRRFLPSSRSVAFRKSAWEAVGGYPEWLDYSEDVVFDLEMRARFGDFALVPEAGAHFRPRQNLIAFVRQYFNYAGGDGRAGLFPRIHFIRYFTYLVAAPLGLYAALTVSPLLWAVGVLAGVVYIRTPLRRMGGLWGGLSSGQKLRALLWVPIIRIAGDCAKMAGYPVGWLRRMRRV